MIEKLVTHFITWLFTPSTEKEPKNLQVPNPNGNKAAIISWLRLEYDVHVISCYYNMAKQNNAPADILALIEKKLDSPYKDI